MNYIIIITGIISPKTTIARVAQITAIIPDMRTSTSIVSEEFTKTLLNSRQQRRKFPWFRTGAIAEA